MISNYIKMARDTQSKSTKKEQFRRSKRLEELNRKKKSDKFDENSDNDEDDNVSDSDNDEEIDLHEYRKYISKMFPSKHMDNKIKAGERLKKLVKEKNVVKPQTNKNKNKTIEDSDEDEDEQSWETDSESEDKIVSKNKSNSKRKTSNNEEVSLEDTDDEEDEDYEDTEQEDIEDYTEEEEVEEEENDEGEDGKEEKDEKKSKKYKLQNSGNGKLNIIFTIGGKSKDEDYDDDYDDDDDDCDTDCGVLDDETENEDEEVSSDESESESESENSKETKNKKSNKKNVEKKETDEKNVSNNKADETTTTETLQKLKTLLQASPEDKSIKKCIEVYEQDLKKQKTRQEKKCKKQQAKNLRIFRKILKDKNTMNDFTFYEKLDIEHQKKIIKELKEINKITRIEKPYRMTLLESNIPVEFKSAAMKKINALRYMEPGSGEFYKSKNWVDAFMRIPFNKIEGLPISINDGVEKCHEFMENAQKTLDQAVYGLNDAKMQIMQMIGQLLTNPSAIGTAIAIHGPPGTGKTSLVKEGISKILNRPFAFIALGGATDSSFLEGHGYTYEGSTWGKIVQILIESKCMNPVIYFDELDKISETPRGEEIAGILTHLTDTTQNSQFHDKYFTEINFDLSKCLFIFSYNDERKVNPILKDRMYRIKTKGYISKEKTIITNNYLLPKIREQVRFNEGEITIPNDVIGHIIDTHCNKEDGVRNLKRCLEIIYTKLNLYRLMKPGSNIFEGEMALKVEFPFNVTKEIVDKLIKRETDGLETWRSLYL
jgi:ATP-dependent Lon protease